MLNQLNTAIHKNLNQFEGDVETVNTTTEQRLLYWVRENLNETLKGFETSLTEYQEEIAFCMLTVQLGFKELIKLEKQCIAKNINMGRAFLIFSDTMKLFGDPRGEVAEVHKSVQALSDRLNHCMQEAFNLYIEHSWGIVKF